MIELLGVGDSGLKVPWHQVFGVDEVGHDSEHMALGDKEIIQVAEP